MLSEYPQKSFISLILSFSLFLLCPSFIWMTASRSLKIVQQVLIDWPNYGWLPLVMWPLFSPNINFRLTLRIQLMLMSCYWNVLNLLLFLPCGLVLRKLISQWSNFLFFQKFCHLDRRQDICSVRVLGRMPVTNVLNTTDSVWTEYCVGLLLETCLPNSFGPHVPELKRI